MSLWLRCNRGVRGVGVGRRPCPYGDELQPRYSNSEEIAVWFSSWGSSPQHGDLDTKPRCTRNAPGLLLEESCRRSVFVASASADVLFNGAFVVQDSEATKASAAPRGPGVRRSPTWCQYPPLRQSGRCAPALVEKDHRSTHGADDSRTRLGFSQLLSWGGVLRPAPSP